MHYLEVILPRYISKLQNKNTSKDAKSTTIERQVLEIDTKD